MIEKIEVIEIIAIGYGLTGVAFTVLFIKILGYVSSKERGKEIWRLNMDIHRFLDRLTVIQKVAGLVLMSVIWLPVVIWIITKLVMCEE